MLTCPMHPQVRERKFCQCPTCGMSLVKESGISVNIDKSGHSVTAVDQKGIVKYKPFLTIIGLIFLVTIALSLRDVSDTMFFWQNTLSYYMTGFFLATLMLSR